MGGELDCHVSVREQGYGLVPGVLTDQDIDGFLQELAGNELPRTRAGVRHAMKNECVARLARDKHVIGVAKTIFGTEAFPFRATLFEKLPHSNWLVAWHQDTALPLRERREMPGWGPWSVKDGVTYAHAPASALEQVLALRVHLDDSTPENGPLRVLPRTHVFGVLTDDAIHQLSTQIEAVECPIARGGILAMRPLIVHASSKSRSANPRRVLHIEYAALPFVAGGLELAVA